MMPCLQRLITKASKLMQRRYDSLFLHLLEYLTKFPGGSFTPIKKYKLGTFARCVNECAYHLSSNAVEFIKAGKWLGHCQLYQLSKEDSGKWGPRKNRASARLIQMGQKDDFFQRLLTSSAISEANYQRVRNCWRAIKNFF